MGEKRRTLEAEIAELYGQPLAEWTAARDALAKRLAGEGSKAEAGTVKALRKPSLSVWAVNQLWRSEGERMGALLAAGERARAAQGHAVAGRGADAFREALKEARRQIEDLRRRAVALLGSEGKGVGAAISERIGRNLEALAFSPAAAAEGARGYLDADLDPPGFEVLSGVPWSVPEKAEPSRLLHFKAPAKETQAATTAAATAARREEAEAARRARAEAQRQERIERAAAAVSAAQEKAAALRTEAAAAERESAEAQKQAAAAERAAAALRRRVESAEADLARAEERLKNERSGTSGRA